LDLKTVLEDELKYEIESYKAPAALDTLPGAVDGKPSPWKLEESAGDVNLALTRTVEGGNLDGKKLVKLQWQLSSPFDPSQERLDGLSQSEEGENGQDAAATAAAKAALMQTEDSTDFTLTIESADKRDKGITLFCSTQQGEGHRFIVGQVKSWASEAERDSASSYNGPEFEDLDEKVQAALDDFLGETIGLDDSVCDFIDESASDKEHREYVRWLGNVQDVLK
jgi:complement component 1 Q subcomponent-binding protein, mitochondrial